VPHCECGEQGSSPGVNRRNNEQENVEEKILNKEQARPDDLVGRGMLNDEVENEGE
jgi:hypothetical protein